jgi:PAS domain S-box-containing protein
MNAEGRFTAPQPSWEKYTGQKWDDHQNFGWLNAIHSDDRERFQNGFNQAQGKRTVFEANGRMWHAPSGQWRFFVCRASPIMTKDGELKEWVGACTDVHDQKKAEDKLEQTVVERTAKLQETIADLEAFSYSVSHDLRSPLRAMQGYSEELLKQLAGKLSSENKTYLERIHRAASRLDRLTQEVLTYSRLSRTEITLQPIDLGKLIHEIVEQYPNITSAKAEIKIEDPLLGVIGHESFLTQAVSNLLSNAVKFVAPGEIPKILVRTEAHGEWVRLWVEDHGIGIDPRHRNRIYQIFGRIHPDAKYEGTGIGLAVVKKSVEKMNGRVGFESSVKNGSKFWIELPSSSGIENPEQSHTLTNEKHGQRR